MTKRILVTESEKNRILGLHQKAISREFLNEQQTIPPSTGNTQIDKVVSLLNNELQKTSITPEEKAKVQVAINQIPKLPKISNTEELHKKMSQLNLDDSQEKNEFVSNFIDAAKTGQPLQNIFQKLIQKIRV